MSIKIEFEAATGADLRKEMLDLLGIGQGFIGIDVARTGQDKSVIATVEDGVVTKVEDVSPVETTKAEEAPKPEQSTRKRRSKAEIEAEAALAASTGTEEPPASTGNATPEDDGITPIEGQDDTVSTITAEDLTKKCVELGRGGKRDAVLAVFESQFGGATISKKDGKPQLTADQYPAVMEALNAIA